MSFDPDTILDAAVDGEMSTSVIQVPEGEYEAMIVPGSIKPKSGESQKTGEPWHMLNIGFEIVGSPEVEEEIGRTPRVRASIFLDVDEKSGGLDTGKGKNTQLGRLREATGTNGSGSFSLRDLEGQTCIVTVEHEMYNGEPIANVTRFAAA